MSQILLSYLKGFSHLFISNTCCSCGRSLITQEKFVCFSCLSQMPETHFHMTPQKNELYYRLGGKVDIMGASSLYYFDKAGILQRLIEQIKYKQAPYLGKFLGAYYGHKLMSSGFIQNISAIVPIPLHRRKKLIRGYNQAEEIAAGLSSVLSIPLQKDHLVRTRFTQSQTRFGGQKRWENVSGAFQLRKDLASSILLVDDVVTTGATLEACIRAIHQKSNTKVRVLSVGLARKH